MIEQFYDERKQISRGIGMYVCNRVKLKLHFLQIAWTIKKIF